MTSALMARIVSFENLHHAAYQVMRGKRSRASMGDVFMNLERELYCLQAELRAGRYQPGPYRTFWIQEPKKRMISAAPLIDRIVHHALVQVTEPIFERRFIHHSYACRKGKGTHRCLAQFTKWSRNSRYALKLDIRKFFPSIDHEVLKGEVSRAHLPEDVESLIGLIIDSSNPQEATAFLEGEKKLNRRGLPIGNLTSQFLGNVLLDRVDHLIKDRLCIKRYLRYVDDLVAFHEDKCVLRALRAEIVEELAMMRLVLNERKSRSRQLKEGIEFLGFVIRPERIRLGAVAVRRQRRRMKRLHSGYRAGELELFDVSSSLRAFCAHAAHGDAHHLLQDIKKRPFVRTSARRQLEFPTDHRARTKPRTAVVGDN